MAKLYVPDYTTGQCAYVNSATTLRVYESQPAQGRTINYVDYYYNSHYYFVRGSTTFSNYSTLPNCLSDDDITTNYYFRTDFSDIIIIFGVIVFMCWFLISLLVKNLLKGKKYL